MRIPLENVLNLRDLGGLTINLNEHTKNKQFLRSDLFLKINQSEIDYLVDYGVKVIVDLREPNVVKNFPDLLNVKPFIYYNVSLIEYTPNDMPQKPDTKLYDSYVHIIEKKKDKIKEVFDIFVKHNNETILFHCFAGKDRTGIISYLLLSIVGVPFTDIIVDYTTTDGLLYPYIVNTLMKKDTYEEELKFWVSPKENIINLNDYILKEYGSPVLYLVSIGLSLDDIQSIRLRLTESN
jgi:protein-tyrosine phosphatase